MRLQSNLRLALYANMTYNETMKKDAKHTTVRLTPEAKELIKRLSAKLGINQTSVLEMAIRVLAEKENVR